MAEANDRIKDLEMQVEKLQQEIRRSHLLRETLIRIIGHDLRGPISNLKSVVSLTREDQVGIEQVKSFMEHIDAGINHSVNMLDELTEWGRATAQEKKVYQEDLVVKATLDQIIDKLSSQIEKKEISLTIEGDLDAVCTFDKNALSVVLRNILSNAVKFTERGGSIHITIAQNQDHVILQVADSGIGIPEETMSNLFEMKKDTKRPGTENEKSAGVGLFITKDLIDQNAASIIAKQNPEGKGTLFILEFKKATA